MLTKKKDRERMGDVFSGEFENTAKYEHRICPAKYFMGSTQTLIQAERANTQGAKTLCVCSFSVSEVFAVAKVKLCNTQ